MGLSTTYTKAETDYLLQKLQSELASGLKGELAISDTAPTTQGLYILSDVGNYTNLGGIITTADKLNYAYFDGTTWSLVVVDVPMPPIIDQITLLANQNDILTNNLYPYFFNVSKFVKSGGQRAMLDFNEPIIGIVSRDDDYNFTVNPSDLSTLENQYTERFSIVINDNGRYRFFSATVKDKSNGKIKVGEILPSTITSFQFASVGQHLTHWGYTALAHELAYMNKNYRKKPIFSFIADNYHTDGTWEGRYKMIDQNNNIAFTWTEIGNPYLGQFVVDGIEPVQFNLQPKASQNTSYKLLKSTMYIANNKAGDGISMPIVGGIQGYIKIMIGENITLNESTLTINLKKSSTTIFTKNIRGGLQEIIIPITINDSNLTLEFITGAGKTIFGISSIEVFSGQYTEDKVFKHGDKVAFLMDSWGEYPLNIAGDTNKYRADGSTSSGQMYMSEKFREYLSTKEIIVSTYNYSKGGQTSAWARYWFNEFILNSADKPDYVIFDFAINDSNSVGAAIDDVDSYYDFSPTEPYINLFKSAGGIKGSVTKLQWLSNMQWLCNECLKNGIKPIILHNLRFGDANDIMNDFELELLNTDFGNY